MTALKVVRAVPCTAEETMNATMNAALLRVEHRGPAKQLMVQAVCGSLLLCRASDLWLRRTEDQQSS